MVLPTLLLTVLSVFPASLGSLKFVPLYKALTIRANKKLPPHIAYLDSHFDIQSSDWASFDKRAKLPLLSGVSANAQQGPYVLTQNRTLEGITIRKSTEVVLAQATRNYKTESQARQETEGPQWLKNIVRPPTAALGTDSGKMEVSLVNLTAAKRITGQVELKDGLAVTNEHHIEVRRSNEGIFHEMGRVDLAKGSYSIDVDETSGFILARLIDKSGVVLGEGSIRLSQLQSPERLIYGPRLEIAPSPAWTGNVGSYYPKAVPPAGKEPKDKDRGRVTALGGESEIHIGKAGEIKLDNVARGSVTIVRAEVPEHLPSNKMMIAGDEQFTLTNFPVSMMKAMKSIVTEPGAPQTYLEDTTFVWGTVTVDGKPVAGVSVLSETDSEVKPIYFNEFMIPDPKLTATSSSGIYAFMNIQQGFNAILAQRGDAYFGHQNVVVESGTVAMGDIQNTLHTESVRVRAFDAFAGEPVHVVANMQSQTEPLQIQNGNAVVILPQVSRTSMIYTEVEPGYVAANYFYNDKDSYIHLPILRQEWLANLRIDAKLDEVPNTGTIVGFFGDENFEAYLAKNPKDSPMQIIYFDGAGRVSATGKGVAGGGFVMFNVPPGTQETVLLGVNTERIYSKVVPVDSETTSVLSFTSY
jgi:hypothetical protein